MSGSVHLFTVYRARAGSVPAARAFCVREWILSSDDCRAGVVGYAPSLEQARERVPAGAGWCLGREPEDDPAIVETWI